MAGVADLIIRMQADTRQASQEIAGVDSKISKFGSAAKAAMGVVAAAGAFTLGKQLFEAGVEAEALGRRFDTVFGNASGIRGWVDDVNERFGVSEVKMQGIAASVGDLLVPMGFTRQASADLTQEVLTLAGALSEWTGGTIGAEDAASRITRAFLGEREALIPLGVKISELDVQSRLAAKGQKDLEGDALIAAKAMITLELATERSADALSAYEEGASPALEASNNFKAAIDDLKFELGEVVVAAAPLLSFLADLVGAIIGQFGPIDKLKSGLADLVRNYEDYLIGLQAAASGNAFLTDRIVDALNEYRNMGPSIYTARAALDHWIASLKTAAIEAWNFVSGSEEHT